MKPREYTYYRIIFIVQILLGVSLALIVVFNLRISATLKIILSVVTLISNTVFVLLFYKTSITVYESHILFRYGIGVIKVPIEMKGIKACVPLNTPRVGSNGFIARIKMAINKYLGVKAVEIQFFEKDSVLQLETRYPVEICEEVAFYLAGKHK